MLHTPISSSLWRTTDPVEVNAVLNHPEVLPTAGLGAKSLDASVVLANPRNIALMGEYGGAIFMWSAPGIFEAHDYFLPAGRGAWAKQASRSMLDIMFDAYGASMVWAQTPIENRACRIFNRILGFNSMGVETVTMIPGAAAQSVEVFIMRKDGSCQ